MTLSLQEVARAIRAEGAAQPVKVAGWSVDTRTQNPGDVYFALRGPVYDGHDFVHAAVQKGAAAVVVERKAVSSSGREGAVERQTQAPTATLIVDDTLRSLQQLGAWARQEWGGTVVGVTGSAGKTTTKDAIAHLLSAGVPVGKTVGNFNNHVGVPLSILRLPDGCRAAVLEMGMNHAGEIRALAAIARPQLGVVTNVGYAHVEFFDSIEGVAAAKRELIEGLPRDGVAVLNADDPRVARFAQVHPGRSVTFGFAESADVRAEFIESLSAGMRFRALGIDYETSLTGRHAVSNLLAAIAVAREFGIAPERLHEPVRTFAAGKMRGERIEWAGMTVWDDCYNSNPEAARSMIDVLRGTPAERRIAVLGEMLELGEASGELHSQVGEYAAGRGIDLVIGVHGAAKSLARAAGGEFFSEPEEAGDYLRSIARAGDALLFKGSRGVHMERALERLMEGAAR